MEIFHGNRRLLPITDYTGGSSRKRGTTFDLEGYRRIGNSQVEVYDRVGKLNMINDTYPLVNISSGNA